MQSHAASNSFSGVVVSLPPGAALTGNTRGRGACSSPFFPPPSWLECRSTHCSSKNHFVTLRQTWGWMVLEDRSLGCCGQHGVPNTPVLLPPFMYVERKISLLFFFFKSHCYFNSNLNRYTTQKRINTVWVILWLRPRYRLSRGSSYSIVSIKQATPWLPWGYDTHKSCLSTDSPRRTN